MSLQSLYIHGIDSIDITRATSSASQNLIFHRASESPFEVYAFAPDEPPDITFEGVDVPALLDAARAALRALNEAHEGNPIALPLGVTEARACLLSVLEGRQ